MQKIFSEKAYNDALKLIPGGVNSPVRAFKFFKTHPLFIKKGNGSKITDIDGNEFTDFCLSWGVHLLGYSHPEINERVIEALRNGTSFGAPTLAETELAGLITGSVPSVEQIRFVNSGTEAVMSALRLARAYTGRKMILKFDGCYHGHADFLLSSAGSGLATNKLSSSGGVPDDFVRFTLSIPFNDITALEETFSKYGHEIAAVILEPVPANMGVIVPDKSFLLKIRELCDSNQTVMVFDEVITGFRWGIGGAQETLGIKPDITTFGKIIGGGFPVGAFGGKKEIMQLLAPEGPVYQAGTLSGNPVAMAAGIATLKTIREQNIHQKIKTTIAEFKIELENLSKEKNITLNFFENMFSLFFRRGGVRNYADALQSDTDRFRKFYLQLLEENIYFSPSPFEANFISAAHTEYELEKTAGALKKILNNNVV
jgi:glutamate-1-semialdehyde 2,1-aminomutase